MCVCGGGEGKTFTGLAGLALGASGGRVQHEVMCCLGGWSSSSERGGTLTHSACLSIVQPMYAVTQVTATVGRASWHSARDLDSGYGHGHHIALSRA
jgi:hypothetical protein